MHLTHFHRNEKLNVLKSAASEASIWLLRLYPAKDCGFTDSSLSYQFMDQPSDENLLSRRKKLQNGTTQAQELRRQD